MSTTTGSPARISPGPDSWPRAHRAPRGAIPRAGAPRPHLAPRRAPGLGRGPGPQLADQRRRDAHRRIGRLLRAADALELGAGLDPAAPDEHVRVDAELDAGGAQ